jgi:hypothetical protein
MAKDDQSHFPVYLFFTANSEAGKSQGVPSLLYHSVLPSNTVSVLLCLYLAGKKSVLPFNYRALYFVSGFKKRQNPTPCQGVSTPQAARACRTENWDLREYIYLF